MSHFISMLLNKDFTLTDKALHNIWHLAHQTKQHRIFHMISKVEDCLLQRVTKLYCYILSYIEKLCHFSASFQPSLQK